MHRTNHGTGVTCFVCLPCSTVRAGVRCMQMEFWTELSQDHPSLSVLDKAGTEYERCVKGAERGFQTVLQLDPASVSAMRGYAQFLIEVGTHV